MLRGDATWHPDGRSSSSAYHHSKDYCVRKGKTLVTDGPFAETKEQLAGMYILDCKNMDEALELAVKIPDALYGSIEIRPVLEM